MSKLGSSLEFEYSKVPENETKKEQENAAIPKTYGYGIRHVQLVIFFFFVVISFIARGHLGVTLVAMTSHKNATFHKIASSKENYTNFNDSVNIFRHIDIDMQDSERDEKLDEMINGTEKLLGTVTLISNYDEEPRNLYSTFSWSKPIQEMALTSFFTGYCLMMFPIALVCQRWGGKVPLQLSMLVNGVVSILTPWLAHWGGWQALCVCRLLQGFSQAGTYPGIQTLLAQWVPDSEKGTLTSYVYTGATTGSVLGFQIGGLLSDWFGWPAAFWAIGALCLVMFTLITFFVAKSPRVHGSISEEERKFIIHQTQATAVKPRRAPWKSLVSSKPLLANYCSAVGTGVAFVFFFTQVPSYIHYIHGIDVKNSGLLSSLPYIASMFASIAYGVISDYLINHRILTKRNARRYSNLVATLGMGSALVGASYAHNTIIAVIWFVVFMVSHMGVHTGWLLNQIDLAPNYSGTMIAISNALTNFVVMMMPFVISNVIVDLENVFQWRIMLFVEAAIAIVPGIVFAVYVTSEVQPWNDGPVIEEEIKSVTLESIEKNGTEKEE